MKPHRFSARKEIIRLYQTLESFIALHEEEIVENKSKLGASILLLSTFHFKLPLRHSLDDFYSTSKTAAVQHRGFAIIAVVEPSPALSLVLSRFIQHCLYMNL